MFSWLRWGELNALSATKAKGMKVHNCGGVVYQCFLPAAIEGLEGEKVVMWCVAVIIYLLQTDITLHKLSDGTPKPEMADG